MLSSNAEKIYWLSRYIERAENTARLINVNFDLLLDIPHDQMSDIIHLVEITSNLEQFNQILIEQEMFYNASTSVMKNIVLDFVIYNRDNKGSISYSLEIAKKKCFKKKPICILLKTIMGNGVDFMMHTHAWHGKAPNDEQLASALKQNPETLGDY